MIAMALACDPKLLHRRRAHDRAGRDHPGADPAPDQALSREHEAAVILITHDLGVVAGMCRRILVMYAGRIVESGPGEAALRAPAPPVHRRACCGPCRGWASRGASTLQTIEGLPPDLAHLPPGCAFAPRCDLATDACWAAAPSCSPTDDGRQRPASTATSSRETAAAEAHGVSRPRPLQPPQSRARTRPRRHAGALSRTCASTSPSPAGSSSSARSAPCSAVDGVTFDIEKRRDPGPRRRERLRQDDDRPRHPAAHPPTARPRALRGRRPGRARGGELRRAAHAACR